MSGVPVCLRVGSIGTLGKALWSFRKTGGSDSSSLPLLDNCSSEDESEIAESFEAWEAEVVLFLSLWAMQLTFGSTNPKAGGGL